ncbi:MAG: preprotein translocase subunit YajC [Aeriscardovia sp.]|nr:preprotein translocase subunit YajC [Aeriscardovia sp.]MBR3359660.1 preprotein translocase subunit YajC [Aeriscardovia sp.]
MGSDSVMVIIIVLMCIFMWWSMRKQRKSQKTQEDWRKSLHPGDPVATVSGLLGTVESVDIDHDQIVINSEGSLSRWRIQAIVKAPIVPAYVDDNGVSEADPVQEEAAPAPESAAPTVNEPVEEKPVEAPIAEETVVEESARDNA